MNDLGYHDLLAQITARFGITFTSIDNGGGCLIWETRLETGDWLWVSDYDPWITPLPRRLAAERDGITVGWQINIYANQTRPPGERADSCTCLAGVHHATATAEQLPDLIEEVLRSLPGREHHGYAADGTHAVHYGVQHY